ncbi:MAG: hypothetical protein M1830_001278 [Pleopsidium flavum]|nr:MAG: hypothetical protein M1830_001278 [Pleopsidium flavum]
MVVEREPPKAPASPNKTTQQPLQRVQQPEFGKSSPLRNPFDSSTSVFNVPKPHQPRPEHHRPAAPSDAWSLQQAKDLARRVIDPLRPQQPSLFDGKYVSSDDRDVFEIPKPANRPTWTTQPSKPPTFSSHGAGLINNFVDLTSSLDRALSFDEGFGASDPYTYIDAEKANENIKALLEGAFEDEEDKPRTRGRKKKLQAEANGLVDKLKGLTVEDKDKAAGAREEEEEEEEEDDGTVEGLNVKLLPHQVDGVSWMRDKEVGVRKKNGTLPKGGILADDMGLGKTIQSIALMLTNPKFASSSVTDDENERKLPSRIEKGTLVVAPLALIKQWEAEIKNRVSDSHKLRVYIHHGPQRTKRFQDLKKYDVVITTYQILVSEHGSSSEHEDGLKVGCFGLHWYRVILDEAHSIKNRNAKATKACYALRAEYRWCLTGTPMQNNLDELQSLIKFLRIKPYNDLSIWRDQITRPMSSGRGGVAIKRLQFYLKAFMKRRTKDVLKQEGALNPGGKASAPDGPNNGFKITERKIEEVITEFSPEERRFYERLEARTDKSLEQMMNGHNLNYASALVLLLRLRQACNHPELTGGSMTKDHDALTTGSGAGAQTPRKTKAVDKELDDVADLLGGLSVETKKCDVCQIKLEREQISLGAIRCIECEEDLAGQKQQRRKEKKHKHPSSHNSGTRVKKEHHKPRTMKNRRLVVDSEDEDEEQGDWVVPERQRHTLKLGKAGGSDDENAEGGGEWLKSEDSETGDESDVQIVGASKKKVINLDTTDEEDNSAEDDDEEEAEEDESSEGEAGKVSITASTKIRHLLEILHRESAKQKFIVFSQFTSMLDLIEPFLKLEGLVFTRYDGSMKNDAREASLERLRNEKKTRILLCSLKCGSLGLNLTAASRVVILEPFWNPFVEEQAIDRVHRLNQTVDVVVYKLTVKDTVEERILELQEKKRELANATIEGKAVGKLSMKDILNLFKRDAEHAHHDDAGMTLGGKTRVLNGGKSSGVRGVEEKERMGMRISPPIMERHRVGNAPREDSISRTPSSINPPPSHRPYYLTDFEIATSTKMFTTSSLRQTILRTRTSTPKPASFIRQSLPSVRPFHTPTTLSYPRKDSQDKDDLKPEATEYSKSGTDDGAAKEMDAAFNPEITSPEGEKGKAAEGNGDSNNPLEVSPANTDVSHARDSQEGGAQSSSSSSGSQSDRKRSSGQGSVAKNGKGA